MKQTDNTILILSFTGNHVKSSNSREEANGESGSSEGKAADLNTTYRTILSQIDMHEESR